MGRKDTLYAPEGWLDQKNASRVRNIFLAWRDDDTNLFPASWSTLRLDSLIVYGHITYTKLYHRLILIAEVSILAE